MKKKLLSLALALALCLGLTLPAFAAETLNADQLTYGDWGDGPSLTLSGVTGMTKTPIDPTEIYDVEVGGSLVLEMTYPAGKNRTYQIWMLGVYVCFPQNPSDFASWEYKDTMSENWDLPASAVSGDFDASSGRTQYVYHFTASDMGQKGGCDKIVYPYIYWCDDADGNGEADSGSEGSAYFGVRVVPASKPTVGGFTDVPADQYYAEPVVWAVEKGITSGTGNGKFSPHSTCTQAQILTFIWRASGKPQPKGAVTSSEYYATAVKWAEEQGLIDTFSANAPCTRAMVVTYLWKQAGSPELGYARFADVPTDSAFAPAVSWALAKSITSGTGNGNFSPDQTCTRGQIATFLYRAFAE